jgi:hypothetical protein
MEALRAGNQQLPPTQLLLRWPAASAPWTERHYTHKEVAELWDLSSSTITRLFRDEPGVLLRTPSLQCDPGVDGRCV